MLRIGLQARYTIAVSVGMALVAALVWTSLRVQRAGDAQMAQLAAEDVDAIGRMGLERRGRTVAELLADALTNPVYFVDLKAIGEITRSALRQPDVEYVLVFDANGRILHDGSANISRFGQQIDLGAATAVQSDAAVVQYIDGNIDVVQPMFLGSDRLGGVRVGFSRKSSNAAAAAAAAALLAKADAVATERARALLWPLSGLALLLFIGLWMVAYLLVRPVRALAAHARALEAGRFDLRIETDRPDEIGDLMRSMGALGASLARHDRDIRRLAYIDTLTGLPNRLVLREELERATMLGRSSGAGVALLFIDLDDFKRINDTLGHDAGDEALGQLAQRLEQRLSELRGSDLDLISRFGGDEFVALLTGSDLRERARRFADSVLAAVREPLLAAGRAVHLNASVGITVFPEDGNDPPQLMKNGDIAMYQAKLAGKNCYRFFTPMMTRIADDRLHLEHDLRAASAAGELDVHYQPIVDLRSGVVTGVEALLRWDHPHRGLVPSTEFVGIAEDFGLIGELGRFALERACQDAARWPLVNGKAIFVSVNVSARQLREPDLPKQVADALERFSVPAQRLHVELTESALLDTEAPALATLAELRQMGVSVWLDDFGTGFSGLTHLRRVPVDGVKIDRSFVQDLLTDRDDLALTTAIVAMAASLGFESIAEGVESAAQLEVLRELGCDLGQGYWLGYPMAHEELMLTLLAGNRPIVADTLLATPAK